MDIDCFKIDLILFPDKGGIANLDVLQKIATFSLLG